MTLLLPSLLRCRMLLFSLLIRFTMLRLRMLLLRLCLSYRRKRRSLCCRILWRRFVRRLIGRIARGHSMHLSSRSTRVFVWWSMTRVSCRTPLSRRFCGLSRTRFRRLWTFLIRLRLIIVFAIPGRFWIRFFLLLLRSWASALVPLTTRVSASLRVRPLRRRFSVLWIPPLLWTSWIWFVLICTSAS